jgi:hypothetical protein
MSHIRINRPVRPKLAGAIVAVIAMVLSLVGVVLANSAQAVAPVHYQDLGTSAPPTTLGTYTMLPFAADARGNVSVDHAVSPSGNVPFSPNLTHDTVPATWASWSNGYTGDVYETTGTTETLTMPANTTAFYLYSEPEAFGLFAVTATTDNGTSSGAQSVNGNGGARGAGFYTDDGTYLTSITVTVDAAANGFAVGEFGIAEQATKKPKFTSASATTFTAGSPGSFNVTTQNNAAHPVATLSCPGCVLPSGVTFTPGPNGTALIQGTPAATAGGSYTLNINATNAKGTTVQVFTLDVNQSPTLTGSSTQTWTVGTPVAVSNYVSTGYPLPAPTITITAGSLPAGVTLGAAVNGTNGNGDLTTTVAFTGTPAAGSGGTYSVTLTAHNGVAPDKTLVVSITVNEAPTISFWSGSTTFTVGSSGSFYVAVNPGFPPSTVTVTSAPGPALPSGLTLSHYGFIGANDFWQISGTPAVGTGGAYSFTFTANNGVAPNGTVVVPVIINEAPEFTSANTANFTTGQANSFTVTTMNGYPLPKILTINAGCLPAGITFVDNGNGTATISGNPALNTAGPYVCTITASNGDHTASNTQTFTLWIRPPVVLPPATESAFANGALAGVPMTVFHGQTITVSGSGYAPYAPINIAIYDYNGHNEFSLGSTFADATGAFSGFVTNPIPSSTVYRGNPSDVISIGVGANGLTRTLRGTMYVN